MKGKYTPHIILITSLILLCINIYRFFFTGDQKGIYLGILSNVLLILSMIFVFIDRKKKKELKLWMKELGLNIQKVEEKL